MDSPQSESKSECDGKFDKLTLFFLFVLQAEFLQVLPAFTSTWFRERLFEQKPESFPIPVAPARDFCIALFTS